MRNFGFDIGLVRKSKFIYYRVVYDELMTKLIILLNIFLLSMGYHEEQIYS